MNLKESIERLKEAREKCVNTVDKSTLEKIDNSIEELENMSKVASRANKMKWLSVVVQVLSLIKLAAGFIDLE
ncbi:MULTISPECIES: hypothetical protein [Vibrio]|jgi:tetrahydromethanopterin S-methyltransferase subunit F|uniref:Uncharacterized protein n=1 Tax=Vibrio spartinae TaxID=1918945 RepID=A0A1N6LZZ5_9VIBR|nr:MULTISPECIES: hypothetical protein [Vibrio]EHU5197438.1 hypothetical protein [Vibrio vulnificus]EIL2909758.1 hypothetical protein [Vibrio alginolyticus]EKO3986533.1 hypothetical protein [Vibrio fluvialis]SIO92745.1 hypothetical protein VSP9026_00363 [Vibrio spartinae]